MRVLSLRLLVLAVATLLATALGSAPTSHAVAPTAERGDTPTRCEKGSSTTSGRCYKYLASDWKVTIVESVPMQNRSSKRARFTCTFSRSITRGVEAGINVGYEAKATLFGLVEAGSRMDLSFKVSQTSQQATQAGVSVVLDPGEDVNCLRTYGHVVARVKQYSYSGGRVVSSKIIRTKVPAKLGIRIVD